MAPFEAIRHRRQRSEAREVYADALTTLHHDHSREQVDSARSQAQQSAGEHLTDRARRRLDARLFARLDAEEGEHYDDALRTIDVGCVLDGGWQGRLNALRQVERTWLTASTRTSREQRHAHRLVRDAVGHGCVTDTDLSALSDLLRAMAGDERFLARDDVYHAVTTARLERGLLPYPRHEPSLLARSGERILLVEELHVYVPADDDPYGEPQPDIVRPLRLELTDRRIVASRPDEVAELDIDAIVSCDEVTTPHGNAIVIHHRGGATPALHGPAAPLFARALRLVAATGAPTDEPSLNGDPDGLYGCLHLTADASADDITAAYRRQARLLHPDRHGQSADAVTAFRRIKHAYDVLSDPARRAGYDDGSRRFPFTA